MRRLYREKKVKKKTEKGLTSWQKCDTILPVSERKNNEINKMNNEMNSEMVRNDDNNTVLVSCCGCNEELHISHEEADQWTDTDWFMCHECE